MDSVPAGLLALVDPFLDLLPHEGPENPGKTLETVGLGVVVLGILCTLLDSMVLLQLGFFIATLVGLYMLDTSLQLQCFLPLQLPWSGQSPLQRQQNPAPVPQPWQQQQQDPAPVPQPWQQQQQDPAPVPQPNVQPVAPLPQPIMPRAPAGQNTVCWCCLDEKEGREFGMPTERCTHENNTCKTCLWETLKRCHLDCNKVDIKCPACPRQSPESMDVDDLIALYGVTSECVIQFSNVALQVVSKEEWFRCAWDCQSRGQQVPGGAEAASFLTCGVCQRKTCLKCKVPWHEGQTCQDYQMERKRRNQAEVAAETLQEAQNAGFEVKLCPNPDCGRQISRVIQDKDAECHVMRCCGKGGDHECKNWEKANPGQKCDHTNSNGEEFCGHRFCWECLQDVAENGDTEHLPDCPKRPSELVEDTLDKNDPLVQQLMRS